MDSSTAENNSRFNLTEQVLKSISYHLSRNELSKGLEYVVKVEDDQIILDTPVLLCKYNNTIRTSRKVPAIHHIILDHFPELMEWAIKSNVVKLHSNVLEPGTYKYKRSVTGKSRRWFRVDGA